MWSRFRGLKVQGFKVRGSRKQNLEVGKTEHSVWRIAGDLKKKNRKFFTTVKHGLSLKNNPGNSVKIRG